MRTTIGQMVKDRIYMMVYGDEGVGKTSLIMSLSKLDSGKDIAFITPESSGPTSVISLGYSPDIACEVLGKGDPTEEVIRSVKAFTADKTIRAICVDGCTVLCGRMIDAISDGEGEKALGYEGWQLILSNFRAIEAACEAAVRAGKSVIYTAWAADPVKTMTMGGEDIAEKGRPLIKGQGGKKWLPGNCDIVARMTSTHKKVLDPVTKKSKHQWVGQLQVHATDEWLAKTRWNLPNPCPADLNKVLELVSGQSKQIKTKPVVKK